MSHVVVKAVILGGREFGAGEKVDLTAEQAERLERLGCVERPKAKRSTAAKRAAK